MEEKKWLQAVPTPLAGLALGIAGLGWCWENGATLNGIGQTAGALIAVTLLVLLVCKFIKHPHDLLFEASHPVIGSVIPTFAMATMIVSKLIAQWHLLIGQSLWVAAVVFHILFLILFLYHRIKIFRMYHMIPGWFVPPVGIIVADVAFPGGAHLMPLALGLLYFGMAAYALMLPAMIYRLIFCDEIQDAAKPTIAIMAAPASLSLAGYLTVVSTPDVNIVALLAGIGILMTIVIYMAFFKLLRLPFSPGYAAFTFPMAIGATALFKTAHWMSQIHLPDSDITIVQHLAYLELIVASFVIAYVSLRFIMWYGQVGWKKMSSISVINQ